MSPRSMFDQLMVEFNLKSADFYLLPIIPLIKTIWVDGKNQEGELRILYKFVIEHIAYLDQEAGLQVVTIDDANDFLDRFAHQQPSARLINELNTIVRHADYKSFNERKNTIFEYCLDIAAACVTQYPYKLRDRILQEEKNLLKKLFRELRALDKPTSDQMYSDKT